MTEQTNQHEHHGADPSANIRDVATTPTPETLRREADAGDWLQAHSSALELRAGFLKASRRQLVARIEQKARRSLWDRAWATPGFRFAANAASLGVLLLVLYSFQSVLFSAASVALPGEMLYPVKLGAEQIGIGLTLDEAQRAGLHVELARQRSNELQALMIEGEYKYVEMASLRLLKQVEAARLYLEQAEGLSQTHRQALGQDLNQTILMQALVLKALVNTTPYESQPMVRHVLLAFH
mgnify:CR=1 FL=1